MLWHALERLGEEASKKEVGDLAKEAKGVYWTAMNLPGLGWTL